MSCDTTVDGALGLVVIASKAARYSPSITETSRPPGTGYNTVDSFSLSLIDNLDNLTLLP